MQLLTDILVLIAAFIVILAIVLLLLPLVRMLRERRNTPVETMKP